VNFKPLYILRPVLVVLLPLLLALAPAIAQTVVYQGKTTSLSVVQVPGHTYEWEIYSDATIDFANVTGNCPVTSADFAGSHLGAIVKVHWIELGLYFFKVTARDALGCTMNLKIGRIKVNPIEVEAAISGATLTGACQHITLDASKSIGDIVKYEWSLVGNGGALTNKTGVNTEFLLSPTYTGSLPADFRVRLLVTNRKGGSHSDTINISVDRLPVADVFSSGKLEKDGSMIVDGTVSTGTAINYRWFSSIGKIIGPDDQPTVKLFGAGIYSLEIIDNHGCMSTKSFRFPIEFHQIIFATDDHIRMSWAQDTTIQVLANDGPTVDLVPGSVRVTNSPLRGTAIENPDGTIKYIPNERRPGTDQFDYKVCDELNYCVSATVTILTFDAGIKAPEGFSPNGDGLNETLFFIGLDNYIHSQLYVYTRAGQLVYQNQDYKNEWDGTTIKSTLTNLQLVPTGTYYYILKLGGTNRSLKGFAYIGY